MPKDKRKRHEGSIFDKPPGSGNWYIQYYVREYDPAKNAVVSDRKREHVGYNEGEARKRLRAVLAKVDRGEQVGHARRTVTDLYKALHGHVETHLRSGSRKLKELEWRWKHLAPAFGAMRATDVTPSLVGEYKNRRMKKEGAALATAQRELGQLRRMFRFGKQQGLVTDIPHIGLVKENNIRTGFVEPADYGRMVTESEKDGLWLRTLVELAWTYGWRRGELIGLRVRQVDLLARIVRLDPGTTKNSEGREVPMTPTVYGLLSLLCEGKKPSDAVFTRPNGEVVRSFTDTWRNMCVRAGVGHWECAECGAMLPVAKGVVTRCECGGERKYAGRILHDMRRSAARNYRRNGVAENVVMSITGHKTRSMLDRYSIVNNDDKRRAVATLEDLQFGPRSAPEGAEALGKETTTIQ